MKNNPQLEDLTWNELEQAVENFIAADGPNTADLSTQDFFTLWAQFEQERQQRIVKLQGELVDEKMVLSLTSSTIGQIMIDGSEILVYQKHTDIISYYGAN